jgi:hypothetical protein
MFDYIPSLAAIRAVATHQHRLSVPLRSIKPLTFNGFSALKAASQSFIHHAEPSCGSNGFPSDRFPM